LFAARAAFYHLANFGNIVKTAAASPFMRCPNERISKEFSSSKLLISRQSFPFSTETPNNRLHLAIDLNGNLIGNTHVKSLKIICQQSSSVRFLKALPYGRHTPLQGIFNIRPWAWAVRAMMVVLRR
jgi:hypothetical protein